MKPIYAEALQAGLEAVEHLRRAQPGTGPMTIRKEEREKARELFNKFFEIDVWPKKYQDTVKTIEDAILNLV